MAAPAGWEPGPWDAYVRAHPRATYLQTTAWARVKRSTGWSATNIGADGPPGERFGAQLLTRPIPLLPWRFAYAPRGPLADEWTETTHLAWADALREAARPGPVRATAIVRMDPEIEDDEQIRQALLGAGWRPAHDMQPRRTRIVDLAGDEEALWSDLRKKWRQYVNKARSNGIVVRDVDPATEPDAFEKFHDGDARGLEADRAAAAVRRGLSRGLAGLRADRREPPPVRRGSGRRGPGGAPRRPLRRAGRRAVRRDDRRRRGVPRELPAQVGGDPDLEGAGRGLVRHVGPDRDGHRSLQGRLRRSRGGVHRRVGPRRCRPSVRWRSAAARRAERCTARHADAFAARTSRCPRRPAPMPDVGSSGARRSSSSSTAGSPRAGWSAASARRATRPAARASRCRGSRTTRGRSRPGTCSSRCAACGSTGTTSSPRPWTVARSRSPSSDHSRTSPFRSSSSIGERRPSPPRPRGGTATRAASS